MRNNGARAFNLAVFSVALTAAAVAIPCSEAAADTLVWALVQAYQNNPSLNAQRASLRATDENVPQALSGYRPKLSITANGGENYTSVATQTYTNGITGVLASGPCVGSFPAGCVAATTSVQTPYTSRGVGASATETLYNGMQTANRVRQAESQVMGARETLRVTEQQVLLDAATAYMNLLRDEAILELNRRNVEVLTEQLKQTRDRFNVGEVTRTDVAQAESRLAAGPLGFARRAVELHDLGWQLPPRHRRGAGQAGTWRPRRPLFAANSQCRDFARARRRAPRCRRRHMVSISPNWR